MKKINIKHLKDFCDMEMYEGDCKDILQIIDEHQMLIDALEDVLYGSEYAYTTEAMGIVRKCNED